MNKETAFKKLRQAFDQDIKIEVVHVELNNTFIAKLYLQLEKGMSEFKRERNKTAFEFQITTNQKVIYLSKKEQKELGKKTRTERFDTLFLVKDEHLKIKIGTYTPINKRLSEFKKYKKEGFDFYKELFKIGLTKF